MKNVVLVFSIFISSLVSSAQLLIDTPSLDSSISQYKKSINDINWQFRDPAFGAVFYCTENDSIYWSITNLINNFELELFKPDYFYKYDNEYVIIRINGCALSRFQKNLLLGINDSSLLILNEAFYPKEVLVGGVRQTQIYYKTINEKCNFLLYTEGDFPSKYNRLNPFQ